MSTASSSGDTGLTCIACRLMFADSATQRDHYSSDLHRYNLKRKVAQLPPLTMTQYQSRLDKKSEELKKSAPQELWCLTCKRKFNSKGAFESHEKSKKHLQKVEKEKQKEKQEPPIEELDEEKENQNVEDAAAAAAAVADENEKEEKKNFHEMSDEEILAYKVKHGKHLKPTDCLFCNSSFSKVKNCVAHMASVHSFFIPDVEFVKDVSTLLHYCGQKVGIGNACLYCDRVFASCAAARQHMISCSHTKLPFGVEETAEYRNFYRYGDDEEEEDDEVRVRTIILPDDVVPKRHIVSVDDFSITFNDGRVIGHRALHAYYRQNMHVLALSEAEELRSNAASHYRQITANSVPHAAAMKKQEKAARRREYKQRNRESQQVGVKGNKLFQVRPDIMC